MEKFEEVRRKVVALAENVTAEWEKGKKTDEEFSKLSIFRQNEYLKERNMVREFFLLDIKT